MNHSLETPSAVSPASAASDLAVSVQDLHRRLGTVDALQGLSFDVHQGTCHALFGRNGAGKTTALLCLLDLLRPDQGSVRLFGLDPARHEREVKAQVAFVPDTPAFYPWMTVRGTLDYFASLRPIWNRDLERHLLAERFRLDESRKTSALSKGMRAQLALMCALCGEPRLLILDEPTNGLDPVLRQDLLRTVIGDYLTEDRRRTVLIATHLIGEVEGIVDRFTLVADGEALLHDDVETARSRFRSLRLEFDDEPPAVDLATLGLRTLEPADLVEVDRMGKQVEWMTSAFDDGLQARLEALGPVSLESRALSLEEIFVFSCRGAAS